MDDVLYVYKWTVWEYEAVYEYELGVWMGEAVCVNEAVYICTSFIFFFTFFFDFRVRQPCRLTANSSCFYVYVCASYNTKCFVVFPLCMGVRRGGVRGALAPPGIGIGVFKFTNYNIKLRQD